MCKAHGHRPDCMCGFGTRRNPIPTPDHNGTTVSVKRPRKKRTKAIIDQVADPARTERTFDDGLELLEDGEYDKAIAEFTAAIGVDATRRPAYWHRGTAYHRKCDFMNAIIDYTKAMAIGTPTASDYCRRGIAYWHINNSDKAIRDYNMALLLNPKYIDAYNHRGHAYRACGKYGFALSDYTSAIALDENNKVARQGRRKVLDLLESKLVNE